MANHVLNLLHPEPPGHDFVQVSRASQEELAGMKAKMGWQSVPWVTLIDGFDADLINGTATTLRPSGRQHLPDLFINDRKS